MVKIQRATINKNAVNNKTVLTNDRAQTPLSSLPRVQPNPAIAFEKNDSEQILCYYKNNTSHIQIVRSANLGKSYLERVVFPGQRLLFESIPEAHIEIHTGTMATAILSDRIPCSHLRLDTK